MGKILILIILFTWSLTYANSMDGSHWTLKTIKCTGGSPSPIPSNFRYDWHFLTGSKVEIVLLRPDDWKIGRGHYVMSGVPNLCLNIEEIFYSGIPSGLVNESWCGDYEIIGETLSFTWVVTSPNGGDCAQNVPVTAVFQKM